MQILDKNTVYSKMIKWLLVLLVTNRTHPRKRAVPFWGWWFFTMLSPAGVHLSLSWEVPIKWWFQQSLILRTLTLREHPRIVLFSKAKKQNHVSDPCQPRDSQIHFNLSIFFSRFLPWDFDLLGRSVLLELPLLLEWKTMFSLCVREAKQSTPMMLLWDRVARPHGNKVG